MAAELIALFVFLSLCSRPGLSENVLEDVPIVFGNVFV